MQKTEKHKHKKKDNNKSRLYYMYNTQCASSLMKDTLDTPLNKYNSFPDQTLSWSNYIKSYPR